MTYATDPRYGASLLERFRAPRFAGRLAIQAGVAQGRAGSRSGGAEVLWSVRGAGGRLLEARFLAYGPPALLAACDWQAEQLAGAGVEALQASWALAAVEALALAPQALDVLLVAEDALRAVPTAEFGDKSQNE